jgi:hypothetical protein
MKRRKNKLNVTVNGKTIDTKKFVYLLKNRDPNRTVVNQENPLLDKAKDLLIKM